MVDDTVEDVGFQGVGCAISRASASMMTQSIKGRSIDEAQMHLRCLSHSMITHPDEEPDYDTLGDLETLAGVNEFPTRIKCAVLALAHHALRHQRRRPTSVTTE